MCDQHAFARSAHISSSMVSCLNSRKFHSAIQLLSHETDGTVVASDLTVDNTIHQSLQSFLHQLTEWLMRKTPGMRLMTQKLNVSVFLTRYLHQQTSLKTQSKQLYTVTLTTVAGNKPISVFLDKHSEELSFPNIFWG